MLAQRERERETPAKEARPVRSGIYIDGLIGHERDEEEEHAE